MIKIAINLISSLVVVVSCSGLLQCSFPAPGGPSMSESKAFFGSRVKQESEGSSPPPMSATWIEFWKDRFDYFRENDEDHEELINYIRAARASEGLPPI
jgi:hypothetical protein